MDSLQLDVSQVGVVGLELFGHQEQQHPVEELEAVQGGDAHVKEDSVEHRHRDLAEDGGQEDAEAHGDEDEDVCGPLLPDTQETWLLPGRGARRLHVERLDVVDGQHRGGDEPGQTEDRADDDTHGDNE